MYSAKSIHTDVTIPVANIIKGTKNKAIIMIDLISIVALAFLVSLFVLKCVFILLLNVFEKLEFIALENSGLSMLLYILISVSKLLGFKYVN